MSPLPPTRERPVSSAPVPGAGIEWGDGQPPRRGRTWLRRLGIVLVVSLAVLLGAVGAALFYVKNEIDAAVTPKTKQGRETQKILATPLPNKPTNILLLGSDHRKATTGEDDKRSDTLLLVRLDPKRKSISMLSFPRDLYVTIPGHGESKINDAYTLGGSKLSVETIQSITGLDINMVMNVDFTGFKGVVDQLGGIWVDVDRTYLDNVSNQISDIDIKPGYQLLNGKDALAYARFRHDTRGDFNRIARQQLVMASIKKQIGASGFAKNVPGLFRVFTDNTEVVVGGGNSIDTRVLYGYLKLALGLDGKDVYEVEYEGDVGTAGEASIVVYDKAKMDTAVKAFLSPSAQAREQTADQLVGKAAPKAGAAGDDDADADADAAAKEPAAPAPPDPSTVTVKVLNGSGTGGVARDMAQQLRGGGYQVDPNQANADNSNYAATRIEYATAADKPAADALAKEIPGATVSVKSGSNAFDTKLLVVVGDTGTKFAGASADGGGNGDSNVVGADDGPTGGDEYAGNKVPEKGAARVIKDPEYGKVDFVETNSSKFPIMYPTVREQTSDFEEVYSYQFPVGGTVQDGYRLVAKTADGDYWGLQGTSWKNPPLLEDPTREVTRGKRTYQLYFNGTRLHMVAWHDGKGTYWVSNSVLNNLSNETMLAIADGVQPYV